MAARDAASLVAAAIRAACDAKAPRRTVAAVAAAAVSAVLSADAARPAKQSQDPVPRRAPADSSVGDDDPELGRKVRERRKAKRQREKANGSNRHELRHCFREEIRKLAEDSRSSAKEIERLINGIQQDTSDASRVLEVMNESVKAGGEASEGASDAFKEIANSALKTRELSESIVTATGDQIVDIKNVVGLTESVVVV